ncbi:unnamed protein product [Soboliphyme baturini]|uniref:Membrane associated protein n=1 Tax=Soboliphyme baturini TaxID=241478 RepID=A0A183IH86_9BILA|nr:unnamed protein product [Soboliphyme baturini]
MVKMLCFAGSCLYKYFTHELTRITLEPGNRMSSENVVEKSNDTSATSPVSQEVPMPATVQSAVAVDGDQIDQNVVLQRLISIRDQKRKLLDAMNLLKNGDEKAKRQQYCETVDQAESDEKKEGIEAPQKEISGVGEVATPKSKPKPAQQIPATVPPQTLTKPSVPVAKDADSEKDTTVTPNVTPVEDGSENGEALPGAEEMLNKEYEALVNRRQELERLRDQLAFMKQMCADTGHAGIALILALPALIVRRLSTRALDLA